MIPATPSRQKGNEVKRTMPKLKPDFIAQVKRLAIRAMFSDDELMDRLVLKGGNLLDVIYAISTRASVDVDFSVEGELGDLDALRVRIERALKATFAEIRYEVFDVNVAEVPTILSPEVKDFWGGYQADFKIIERSLLLSLGGNLEQIRRNAASVGKRGSTKFEIDISKYEYCAPKQAVQLDNLTIFAYTPLMVICEKLRALCQQMPEYVQMVQKHPTARARDFVDIHTIAKSLKVTFRNSDMREMLPKVFDAKRVPLVLLGRISDHREFHRPDFESVKDTMRPDFKLQDFDFYFDFVVKNVEVLKALWNE